MRSKLAGGKFLTSRTRDLFTLWHSCSGGISSGNGVRLTLAREAPMQQMHQKSSVYTAVRSLTYALLFAAVLTNGIRRYSFYFICEVSPDKPVLVFLSFFLFFFLRQLLVGPFWYRLFVVVSVAWSRCQRPLQNRLGYKRQLETKARPFKLLHGLCVPKLFSAREISGTFESEDWYVTGNIESILTENARWVSFNLTRWK